jgi:predicted acylesterase/phospholipase RssA
MTNELVIFAPATIEEVLMESNTPSEFNQVGRCDLVLKGGALSGLVYPMAVLELAKRYRFHGIGGASAGAIVAGLTAAAEFARESGGFDRLDDAQKELKSADKLRALFQANGNTRPILDAFLVAAGVGAENKRVRKEKVQKLRKVGRLRTILGRFWMLERVVRRSTPMAYWDGAVIGAVAGILAAGVVAGSWILLVPSFWPWLALLALLFALYGGRLGGLILGLRRLFGLLTVEVPENGYGVCNGMAAQSNGGEGVTQWLHRHIQGIADKAERPLTFGDLEGPSGYKKIHLKDGIHQREGIHLRVVTTNLSEGRPYIFPKNSDRWIFRESEFERLFPRQIVDHLIRYSERENRGINLPMGFYFLPAPEDLPILVPIRISLAFPILFSAVPMYSLPAWAQSPGEDETRGLKARHLVLHWFSDGGISSNFPIHLFYDHFPLRPTFGVTLRYFPEEIIDDNGQPLNKAAARYYADSLARTGDEDPLKRKVWLPKPSDEVSFDWTPLSGSISSFLKSIFNTTQNWRDNALASQPGYRERVVQVRLSQNEGGFKLGMDEQDVNTLMETGRSVAEALREFPLREHQWIRFLLLMGKLEEILKQLSYRVPAVNIEELHAEQRTSRFMSCVDEDEWCKESIRRFKELSAVWKGWSKQGRYEIYWNKIHRDSWWGDV